MSVIRCRCYTRFFNMAENQLESIEYKSVSKPYRDAHYLTMFCIVWPLTSCLHFFKALHRLGSGHRSSGVWPLKNGYKVHGYIDRENLSLGCYNVPHLLFQFVYPVGGRQWGNRGLRVSLFYPAASITLLQYMKIWCNI